MGGAEEDGEEGEGGNASEDSSTAVRLSMISSLLWGGVGALVSWMRYGMRTHARAHARTVENGIQSQRISQSTVLGGWACGAAVEKAGEEGVPFSALTRPPPRESVGTSWAT